MSAATPQSLPPASPWRWWVCILLFLATTMNYMDRIALNQMAVRIQKSLNFDDERYSRLESGFSFSFAIGAILAGIIVDKFSVRWIYPLMVIGWSAAGVMTGFANGFWWLFGCRVALGLFEAGNWPCGLRTTRMILRPEERSFGNSLFQSGTAIGAIVTPMLILWLLGIADAEAGQKDHPDSWKLPFKAIGCIGAVWVLLWFISVPKRMFDPANGPGAASDAGATHFREVLHDRRFWALLATTVAINICWHTYRAWLPKYLQQSRGFTEAQMSSFTTWYYLTADIGSWTIGLLTLVIIRKGCPAHLARLLVMGACAGLALVSLAVPFLPTGWALTAGALVYAFAALGLFPTYYSLSQELSAAHQGKVSGSLGACAHMILALVVYPIQGYVVKNTKSFDEVLAVAGVFPLLALGLMLWLWPPRYSRPVPAAA